MNKSSCYLRMTLRFQNVFYRNFMKIFNTLTVEGDFITTSNAQMLCVLFRTS